MDEIEKLEIELRQVLDTIKEVKEYVKKNKDEEWKPYSSHVLGELKHRSMALKRRITKIQNIATRELWRI